NSGDHYNLLESEALTGFCAAYDLAAGTPGVDPEAVAAARSRLIERIDHFRRHCMTSGGCTTLLRTERNNHSLKSLGALGVCALAIPDHPKAVVDFHDAFQAIHYLAHTYQGDPQGGWAESWNYLNYSGETHLSFHAAVHRASLDRRDPGESWLIHGRSWLATNAQTYGKIRELPAPTHDPLWREVYLHAVIAAQPDGRTLPVDDANPSSLHGGLLAALYEAPSLQWNWERAGRHTGRQLASTFLMFDPEMMASPPEALDVFLKDAGYSVLRSSHATTASFLHMQHEPEKMRLYGSSHEHADPLSFILWAAGEPLAIDPGYIDYANHGKVKYGKDHNIVLVDNQGPEFFLDGLIEAPPNSDGFLHDHATDGPLTTFAASTKYAQAELRRRVVRLARATALGLERDQPPDLFVIADTLISETSRRYTFQLNGLASELIGSTSFSSSAIDHGGRATWTRPKAALHAATLSMVDPTVESRLEESSLASGQHRCFTVAADMGPGAGFLTVLVPVPNGEAAPTFTSRRLADGVLELEVVFADDRFVAWLHTGTAPASSTLDAAPITPGLTVRHTHGETTTRQSYTMALPEIPDPSPFIP
ncbi:MAG TPA: heparinase II/III family protein, partial [Myxococcota bacterium]|nr:heparinase II/III family protein [Myxococcota bacterium]